MGCIVSIFGKTCPHKRGVAICVVNLSPPKGFDTHLYDGVLRVEPEKESRIDLVCLVVMEFVAIIERYYLLRKCLEGVFFI